MGRLWSLAMAAMRASRGRVFQYRSEFSSGAMVVGPSIRDLPLESVPVKHEGSPRMGLERAPLGAVPVREEDEPASLGVEAAADHHARRGPAVGIDGGEGHRGRVAHRLSRRVEPRLDER